MAGREKAQKPELEYRLEKQGPRKSIVRKFVGGSLEAEYTVEDGTCTCPGWFHRQDCKHIQMVYARQFNGAKGQEPQGEVSVSSSDLIGVELAVARQIVTELVTYFEEDVHRIWKDEYVKNAQGLVVEIQMKWVPKHGQENDPPKIAGDYKGVRITMERADG